MKEYFKYGNGFVNLNDENLFLTNSGNWSETLNLEEKSAKSIRKNNFKSFKIYLYIGIVAAFILLILTRSKSGLIPFGFIILGIAAFAYMKRETGKRYKIPVSKIFKIEITESSAKISFYNSNGIEDYEEIFNIEPKGIKILNELNRF